MRYTDLLPENNLASLVDKDQKERQEYQTFVTTKANGDYSKGSQLYSKLKNRSPDDIFGEKERLNQFVQMDFNFESFSDDDWNNYWLLAQHTDFDRAFQKKALNIISKYRGQDSKEFQYLYDRVSCGISGTQKYNTQDICNKD